MICPICSNPVLALTTGVETPSHRRTIERPPPPGKGRAPCPCNDPGVSSPYRTFTTVVATRPVGLASRSTYTPGAADSPSARLPSHDSL